MASSIRTTTDKEDDNMTMTNDEVLVALTKLVGSAYSAAAKAEIITLSGRTCVVGPNEASTMDINPSRIHVTADDNGTITGFRFG